MVFLPVLPDACPDNCLRESWGLKDEFFGKKMEGKK